MNAVFTKSSQLHKAPVECASKFTQLGGMMIESLVGLLILSVIGGGVMHATARMANTQQQQAVNNITVNQMRSMLVNRTFGGADLCAAGINPKVKLPGQTEETAVVVKGCNNVNMDITNVKTGTTTLAKQTVSSMRPVVLEVGTDTNKVRVGGVEVRNATAP